MTIQDLGSLGELIAAIATVATLAYLALQIRHNTRALEHAEQREILDDGNLWRSHLIQNPEIAELYRKGLLDPKALDPIERLRFRMLLDYLFVTWLYGFGQGNSVAIKWFITSGARLRDPAGRSTGPIRRPTSMLSSSSMLTVSLAQMVRMASAFACASRA